MTKAVKGRGRREDAFRDPGKVRAGSGESAEDGPGAAWLRYVVGCISIFIFRSRRKRPLACQTVALSNLA